MLMTFPILLVLMLFAQSPVVSTDPGAVRGPAVTSTDPGAMQDLEHATGRVDNAWGVCPAFSHFHALTDLIPVGPPGDVVFAVGGDGLCHRDDDDSPISEAPRKVLPNPRDKWL
jgi:hypothetical protein